MANKAGSEGEHFFDRVTRQRRALALDALRGFAILTMALCGYIPWGVLPSWMYHAQVPPPLHKFNPSIAGITWVDLVFPFFLFSMGAAIPLALSRRIKRGDSYGRVVFYVLERGVLLAAFGIFYQHIRPYVMNSSPAAGTWLLALLGFVVLFPMFIRLPRSLPPAASWAIKGSGWLGAIIFMALVRYPDGSGFSLYRSDIIIMVLANTVVAASLIWLVTQKNVLVRLSFLGILLALRLSSTIVGWAEWLWTYSPLPWLFRLEYLKYLFIVVPGTIIGDMLLAWMNSTSTENSVKHSWTSGRLVAICLLMFLFVIFLLVGLKARWLVATNLVAFSMCGLGWWLVSRPLNETERLLKNLFFWGAYWLVLGLFFEPYEGGIKKDHATFSYFFVSTGLAIFLMIAFTIIIDIFKRRRWLQLLIDNGQNPMIAYAGIQNLVRPVLALTMLEELLHAISPTPWLGFVRGLLMTLLLALAVSFFTRRKVFWRT
jgi:predicted acyltransferase